MLWRSLKRHSLLLVAIFTLLVYLNHFFNQTKNFHINLGITRSLAVRGRSNFSSQTGNDGAQTDGNSGDHNYYSMSNEISEESNELTTVKRHGNFSSMTSTANFFGPLVGDTLKSKFTKDRDIYGSGCPPNPYKNVLWHLFAYWVNLSNYYGISYFVCGGSLIGLLRHGDIIPYDRDVDLCMSDKEFVKLQPLASRKPFSLRKNTIHIAVQEDFSKDVNYRTRRDCKGRVVTSMRDPCSFNTPGARVLYSRYYIDIFVFRENGRYLQDKEYNVLHVTSDIFPLQSCVFMRIQTKCPGNPKNLLSKYYEPDSISKPHYVCRNNSWVPTAQDVKKKFQVWFI